jgi:hypothetical protein
VAKIISANGLYDALKDGGFDLPEECSDVEMKMPADGLYALHYVVLLNGERLAKFGRALVRMAEKDK